jgi:hypothetical protein
VRAVIGSGVSSAPDDVAAGAWVSRVCCGRTMCDGYAQAACVCVYVRVCMCVCVAADPVRGTQFERVRRLIGDVVVYCWSCCGCGEVACASAILRSVGRNALAAGGCAAAFRARGMRHSGKLPGCCRFWLSSVTVQGGRGTFGGAPLSTRFTVTLKGAIRIPQVRNTCRCFSGRSILISRISHRRLRLSPCGDAFRLFGLWLSRMQCAPPCSPRRARVVARYFMRADVV